MHEGTRKRALAAARLPALNGRCRLFQRAWAVSAQLARACRDAVLRQSLEAILLGSIFLTYAFFYQGSGFNEAARFDAIRALVERGTLRVDEFAGNSADLVVIDGSYYSSKAPGASILGAPVFWVFAKALAALPISEGLRYHLACHATTLLTVSLLSALMALAIFRLARLFGAGERRALWVALALALGTNIFPFATLFMSHTETAALLIFAFAQIFARRKAVDAERARAAQEAREARGEKAWSGGLWSLAWVGALLGFAIALEYTAAIGVAILACYGAWALARERAPLKAWAAPALGFLLGLIPLAWYNWAAFHQVFFVPYEAYRNAQNSSFQAHRKGILGIRVALFEPEYWPTFLSNLKSIAIAPIRGLFYDCPALLAALPGFVALTRPKWRALRAEAIVAGAMAVAYFAMNASYGDGIAYWGGGTSYGPRHVIAALPFFALPMVAALEWAWARRALAATLPISILFCLMATAIEPRAPYAPANPVFSFYVPKFFAGELALNRNGVFSQEPIVGSSVAFNLGGVAGLPASLQLWPLYALWVLAAYALDLKIGDDRRPLARAAAAFAGILMFFQGLGAL
jgi:hypothetical protein